MFPDGELEGPGYLVSLMNDAGFEIRHEENLREHYALTLAGWCANLDAHWDEAVAEVGEGTARVWRLYMAGSRLGFERNVVAAAPGPRRPAGFRRAGRDAAAPGLGAAGPGAGPRRAGRPVGGSRLARSLAGPALRLAECGRRCGGWPGTTAGLARMAENGGMETAQPGQSGPRRDIVLLGSTGSIGTQAADIIRRNPGRFRVAGLAAGGGNPGLLAGPGARVRRRGGRRRAASRPPPARSREALRAAGVRDRPHPAAAQGARRAGRGGRGRRLAL